MPGGIGSSEIGSFADAAIIETSDGDIGRSKIAGVCDTGIEPDGRQVLTVIGVIERLLEEVDANEQLIDYVGMD